MNKQHLVVYLKQSESVLLLNLMEIQKKELKLKQKKNKEKKIAFLFDNVFSSVKLVIEKPSFTKNKKFLSF